MHIILTVFVFFLVDLHINDALRAHDCSSPEVSMTYNIAELGACTAHEPKTVVEIGTKKLAVLAQDQYRLVKVIKCYLAVKATIFYCGTLGNTDILAEDKPNYLKLKVQECRSMALTGTLTLPRGKIVKNIKRKGFHIKVDMVGYRDNKGRCGDNYDFTYNGIKYTANMIWAIKAYWDIKYIPIDRKTNIILGSYAVCQPFIKECRDGRYIIIPYKPRQTDAEACEYSLTRTMEFRVFQADIKNNTKTDPKKALHLKDNLIISKDPNMALRFTILGTITACSQTLYRTNYKGVVVTEATNAQYFKKVAPPNIDYLAHLDHKLYAANGFTQDEVKKIYKSIREEACKTRRMTWQNRFHLLGLVQPGRPGIVAIDPPILGIIAGELLYLIKCQAIQVTLRETKQCYIDIPVSHNNKSMCLEPVTRLLKPTCKTIPCNKIIRSAFRDDEGRWVEYHKTYNYITPPKYFPFNMTWYDPEFFKLTTLKHGGLYKKEDVNKLMQYLYRYDKVEEVTTKLAQRTELIGNEGMIIDQDIIGLINRHYLGFFGYLTSSFRTFGTYVSGFFGLYVIYGMIKYVFNRLVDFQVFSNVFTPLKVAAILLFPPLSRRYTYLKTHLNAYKRTNKNNFDNNDDDDNNHDESHEMQPVAVQPADINDPLINMEPRYDTVPVTYAKPIKNLRLKMPDYFSQEHEPHVLPMPRLIHGPYSTRRF